MNPTKVGSQEHPQFDPYTSTVFDPNSCLVYTTEVDDEDPTANCPKCTCASWKRFCQGRGTRCCLYCRHSRREAGKRKCQYCLAQLSVMFIVFVAALCFTIANRATAIFQQQAEDANGEIDLKLTLSESTPAVSVNYTRVFMTNRASEQGQYNTFRTSVPSTVYSPQCTRYAASQGYDVSVGPHDWMHSFEPIPVELDHLDTVTSCRSNCVSLVCAAFPVSTANVYIVDEEKEQRMELGRNFVWTPPTTGRGSALFMAKLDGKLAARLGARQGHTIPQSLNLGGVIGVVATRGLQVLLDQQNKAVHDGDIANTDYLYRDEHDALYDALYTKTYGGKSELLKTPLGHILQANHTLLLDSVSRRGASLAHVMVYVEEVVSNWKGRFENKASNVIVLHQIAPRDPVVGYRREDVGAIQANTQRSTWSALFAQHPLLYSRNATRLMEITAISYNIGSYEIMPFPPAAVLLAGAATTPAHELASQVLVNLPPERTEVYLRGQYESMLKEIVGSMSMVVAQSGFVGVQVELPVQDEMNALKMFTLFLGLIMSVLLFIQCILSLMLVYSLMMVSVETRTFETAVHRMLGIGRLGIVNMLQTQAFSYSLPAWVQGLIFAQIGAMIIVKMLSDSVGVPLDTSLDLTGILVASLLGLGVPLLASILPIAHALKINIQDALDVQRQGKPSVSVTVERTADNPIPLGPLFLGLGMTICGFCVFYLLPLSLVTMNLALFFNIFFAILIGMLLGLILLAMNIQHLIESLLVFIFLAFETRANKSLVKKNLVAHRNRNNKTSLMYAQSMAFVIFIQVALKTEQNAALATQERYRGADVVIRAGEYYISQSQLSEVESVLQRYAVSRYGLTWSGIASQIDQSAQVSGLVSGGVSTSDGCVMDWGYMTSPQENYDSSTLYRVSNDGNAFEHTLSLRGVSASFSDVATKKFNVEQVQNHNSGLSASEALYTVRGGQSVVIDTGMQQWTGIKGQGRDAVLKIKRLYDEDLVVDRVGIMAVYNSLSGTPFTKRSRAGTYTVLTSIPLFFALSGDGKYISQGTGRTGNSGISEDSVQLDKVLIRTTGNKACSHMLRAELKQVAAGLDLNYWDLQSSKEDNSSTMDMLDQVFTTIMWLTLTLCLFSLTATTYCNVVGSSPEIAVQRALGMTKAAITRSTLEECFILVITSALIGIVIGFLMAWTMLLQRVLFTDLPITFEFPYSSVYWVLLAALVSSIIACTSPLLLIMRQSIATTFKTYL